MKALGVRCIFGPGTNITEAAMTTLEAVRAANAEDDGDLGRFKMSSE